MEDHLVQRSALQEVVESVAVTPVVLIHGPRQAGQITLALAAGRKLGARYVTAVNCQLWRGLSQLHRSA